MKKIILILISLSAIALSGCIHTLKADIQQGNVVTQSMLDQLKPGISKTEVADLLGSPLLQNTFNDNRYDYVYTIKIGHGKMTEQRITCYFDSDRLIKVVGNLHPGIEKT